MKRLIASFFALTVLSANADHHKEAKPSPTAADWTASLVKKLPQSEKPIQLFNGKNLDGWDGWGIYWSVTDGMIRGANEGVVPSSTYLFTKRKFRNFRLFLEVKQTLGERYSTMHSAVAVLGEVIPDKGGNAHAFRGPLLMFCHDWGIWDAHRRSRVVPAGHRGAVKLPQEQKAGWNRLEVLVVGNRIRMVTNGKLVFDFTDQPDMLKPSPVGLQLHSNKRPQEYLFRGLVLTENPEDELVSLDK